MKKTIAILLTALMLAACLPMMLVSVSAADAKTISYVSPAVVPTLDGSLDESAWASTNEFDGVKVLWGEDGFYFGTLKKDLVIKFADVVGDAAKTITIAGGAVTLPAVTGAEYKSTDTGIEIFVPYTHAFDWEWHGFVQERTEGPTSVTEGGVKYATEAGNIVCDFIPKAVDLIGNIMQLGVGDNALASVEMVGPWGYTYVMGGKDTSGAQQYNLIWTGDSWEGQSRSNISFGNDELASLTEWQDVANGLGIPFCFIDIDSKGEAIPKYGWLPEQLAYAVRVTDETAPLIDGVIDNVWETTAKLYHLSNIEQPDHDAYGYISILWSTEGLYFLGYAKDPSVTTDASATEFDHINFNVSETSVAKSTAAENQTCAATIDQLNDAASYAFGVGPCANILGDTGAWKEAYAKGGIKCAASYDTNGYTVEAFVPYFKLTADEAVVGHVMSIQSSVDNFVPGQSGRDDYTNLGDQNSYWSNPSSSYEVVFVDSYDVVVNSPSLGDVYDMITALLTPYQKTSEALTSADVDGQITGYTDELEETLDEVKDLIAGVETSLADYQKAADALTAADVDGKLADYAKKADLDSAVAGVEVKDYTVVVIILFVLVVLEVAALVFVFLKKKA